MFTPEQIKQRREERKQIKAKAKEQEIIQAEKSQKHVKELTITIEWRKSRTWGNNPHASARIQYHDNTYFHTTKNYTCSGCGYDKESTVIAEIFNDFLKYKLYEKHCLKSSINGEKVNHPYGIYYYNGKTQEKEGYTYKPSFNGGVGTDCYYKIAEFIGGKFENIASGKTFDVFKYTDNSK